MLYKVLRYFVRHKSRSYLSFDFALSFYGLIPEAVYTYTSAVEHPTKKIRAGKYSYRVIPEQAFECGVNLRYEGGGKFRIASPEKALCDKLYTIEKVRTIHEMSDFLEEDLRLDMEELPNLNVNIIKKLSKLYPSENVRLLGELIERQRTYAKRCRQSVHQKCISH